MIEEWHRLNSNWAAKPDSIMTTDVTEYLSNLLKGFRVVIWPHNGLDSLGTGSNHKRRGIVDRVGYRVEQTGEPLFTGANYWSIIIWTSELVNATMPERRSETLVLSLQLAEFLHFICHDNKIIIGYHFMAFGACVIAFVPCFPPLSIRMFMRLLYWAGLILISL